MKFKIFISSVQSEFAKARSAIVKMVREKKKVTFAAGMTSEDVLERLGAIDPKTRRISNAAVWLFAKEPQRWRPSWEIRCLQFWGTEVTKPLPALHTYNGTVFEQIDQALDFVMSRVDFYVGAPKKAAAPTKPEFPDDAIREAIVNNELLALAMSWTSYVEKSGSGTTDIIAKCRSWGLGAPEYYPETSDFKTVIWRRGFGPDAVSTTADSNVKGLKKGLQLRPQSWPQSWPQSTDNKIISLLYFGDKSRREISDKIGISFRARSLKLALARLLDDQLIEFTVPDVLSSRNQKYRLTKKARRLLLSL